MGNIVDCDKAAEKSYTLAVDGRELMQIINALELLKQLNKRYDDEVGICPNCVAAVERLSTKLELIGDFNER